MSVLYYTGYPATLSDVKLMMRARMDALIAANDKELAKAMDEDNADKAADATYLGIGLRRMAKLMDEELGNIEMF